MGPFKVQKPSAKSKATTKVRSKKIQVKTINTNRETGNIETISKDDHSYLLRLCLCKCIDNHSLATTSWSNHHCCVSSQHRLIHLYYFVNLHVMKITISIRTSGDCLHTTIDCFKGYMLKTVTPQRGSPE